MRIGTHILALTMLLVSSSLTFAQEPAVTFGPADQDYLKWDTFGNGDDRFHGRFPKLPAVFLTRRDLNNSTGRHTGRIYRSYEEGVACIVIVFDNGKSPVALEQFIDEVRNRFFRSWDMNLISAITLNRDDGQHFAIKRRDINGEVKFFVKQAHSYVFAVFAREANDKGIKRFIEGFTMWDYQLDKAKWPPRTGPDAQAGVSQPADDSRGEKPSKPPLKPEEELIPHVRRIDTPKADATTAPETSTPADVSAYYDRIFDQEEVTTKATIVLKPEALYTEEGRNNTIEGTVKLTALLTRDGKVADVSVVDGLPYGLSESAVNAARNLTFLPAKKDDRHVAQKITLEYVFNLN